MPYEWILFGRLWPIGLFRHMLAFSSSLCNVLAGSGREKKFPDLQSQICSEI